MLPKRCNGWSGAWTTRRSNANSGPSGCTSAHARSARYRRRLSTGSRSAEPYAASRLHIDAAVDVDLLAGDVVAIGRQEENRLRDFLGGGEAPHRNARQDALLHLLGHLGQHAGLSEPGSQRVAGDVVLSEFHRRGLGE